MSTWNPTPFGRSAAARGGQARWHAAQSTWHVSRVTLVHPTTYTITICKLALGFFGGGVRFCRFALRRFCPFFCASKFCLLETLI